MFPEVSYQKTQLLPHPGHGSHATAWFGSNWAWLPRGLCRDQQGMECSCLMWYAAEQKTALWEFKILFTFSAATQTLTNSPNLYNWAEIHQFHLQMYFKKWEILDFGQLIKCCLIVQNVFVSFFFFSFSQLASYYLLHLFYSDTDTEVRPSHYPRDEAIAACQFNNTDFCTSVLQRSLPGKYPNELNEL